MGIGSVTKDKQKLVFFYKQFNESTQLSTSTTWKNRNTVPLSNSSVKSLALEKMEPFSFSARDGLKVHGMFTPGVMAMRGTVVLVHGGPHGPFDAYGWDYQVQFFSQMDISVIQVNFRGSGGFGRNFEEAGYREWSGKMIDDIVEGAEFR